MTMSFPGTTVTCGPMTQVSESELVFPSSDPNYNNRVWRANLLGSWNNPKTSPKVKCLHLSSNSGFTLDQCL